ncbi:MAG: hypothetical protein GX752_02795 [Clostridium sp.]|nr:hypothetical protein [Clostridium sp.]
MHSDFRFNMIRINLLKKAERKSLNIDKLVNFFDDKAIKDVSKDEILDQLEHLRSENYIYQVSENEYRITDDGIKEINEVKKAIKKF